MFEENTMKRIFYLFVMITVTFVRGKTFWQGTQEIFKLYYGNYNKKWDSNILVDNSSIQPKPNPIYTNLNLWIHTTVSSFGDPLRFDRIDPENLDLFTSKLNGNKTIIYICGFLDSNIKLSLEGEFEETSPSLIMWAFFYRNLWYDEYKRTKTASQPDVDMFTNMILVDWHAYNLDYIGSLLNMPFVANIIGDKLYSMTQNQDNPLNLNKLHIIGHSLGAHIAGMIGRRINVRAGKVVVPRVTGLDPAGPILDFPVFRELYPHLDKDCGT